jgi:uncharacterized protein YjcR
VPRVKEHTITEVKIADFFGVSVNTLRNWRKSKDFSRNERYEAFREYYIKQTFPESPKQERESI